MSEHEQGEIMTTPSVYQFTTAASDEEVAMIDVAWQALSRLNNFDRSRAARYLSDRADSHVREVRDE